MLKAKHKTLLLISGGLWAVAGTMLMWKGLSYLKECSLNFQAESCPLAAKLVQITGGAQESVLALIAGALLVGYIKGKVVLKKSAKRVVSRISTLPNPGAVHQMYSLPYWLLYAAMMGMGVMMNLTHCPIDIRGFIDTAVGAALLNGSMYYFRERQQSFVVS